jgi:hypothetical protein
MRINISLFKKQVETVDLRPPPKTPNRSTSALQSSGKKRLNASMKSCGVNALAAKRSMVSAILFSLTKTLETKPQIARYVHKEQEE